MSDQLKEFFLVNINGSYWGPNRGGYSYDIAGAGLYTEEDADRVVACQRGDQKRHILERTDEILGAMREHGKLCDAASVLLATARDIAKHREAKS